MNRPKTRADCINGPRPCPWLGCKYHLLLDVDDNGTIWIHADANCKRTIPPWGKMDPEQEQELMSLMDTHETCGLDLADEGGITAGEVAQTLGVGERRIYEISRRAKGDADPSRLRKPTGTEKLMKLMRAVAAHRRRTNGPKPWSVKALKRQWLKLAREQRGELARGWRKEVGGE
ncbi:MAG: hypothetical protein R3258_10915 [Acidimicrobiia bacterium]|nr:hypothetical protein [Acidimicrobiia bacterium]